MLGNGDGSFTFANTYLVPWTQGTVAVGDFNGDGKTVAAGDFNGDGKIDVVALSFQGCSGGTCAELLSVLFGNGDGTLQTAKTQNLPASLAGAGLDAVADLRGIGKEDLVLSVPGCANCGADIAVLLGNGDGSFQAPQIYQLTGPSASAVVGDFNNDGKMDLAVLTCPTNSQGYCSGVGDLPLGVMLGKGNGTFEPVKSYSDSGTQGGPTLLSADFNEDGNLDLLVGGGVLLGNGDGTFQPLKAYAGGLLGVPAIADINGDGKLDLITEDLGVLLGNGDGTFQPPTLYLPSGRILVGDLNGDGKPDVLVDAAVLLNISSGGLALRVAPGDSSSATVQAGSTANYTLAIGGGGMSGTATLTCSGEPSGATCSLPSSENVSATTPANFKVSISTPSSALLHRLRWLQSVMAVALVGLVWVPVAGRRRTSRMLKRWSWLALVILLAALNACGGSSGGSSSNGGGGSGGSGGGTAYNVTVTATMNGTMQSQVLKLIVQ